MLRGVDASPASVSASLPQPSQRFPSSGFLWADPSPSSRSHLSLPALHSSRLRPGGDIIPSWTTLGSGMGMAEADGAAQALAAFSSSLPPSSSQGLAWPSPCTGPFPGGKFPRSRSWKRRSSWGRLGKPLLLCLRILESWMLHGVTHLGKAQEPCAQPGMERINPGALLENPLCWFSCLLKN